jgi:type I restriction enzyme R subunit
MLFGDCLHKYVITEAIRNENVLKFSVEYISTSKKRENILDINVEAINEEEVMNAPQRLNNVVDYIITNHGRKTHNRSLTAIFCVSSVATLLESTNTKNFSKRRRWLKSII